MVAGHEIRARPTGPVGGPLARVVLGEQPADVAFVEAAPDPADGDG
jgi:hypothetical protein